MNAGEIVAIIGPNGAGKSTALKAVFGLLSLSHGQVRLAGADITNAAPEQVVRQGVCYVPQSENIFPTLTVQENLEMGAACAATIFVLVSMGVYELLQSWRRGVGSAPTSIGRAKADGGDRQGADAGA